MSIAKLRKSNHKPSKETSSLNHIIYVLRGRGYDVDDARSVVNVIESLKLDISEFDFPYGSFDEFKKHVSNGAFDVDIDAVLMSDEHCRQLDAKIMASELWLTYYA